ncbi:hypothetical protein ACI2KE_20710 [Pseudomonas monteilii]
MEHSDRDVSTAEQVRQDVRLKRRLRSQALAALPPPGVAPEFVADPGDMTIKGDALRAQGGTPAAFRLQVPEWTFSDPTEEDKLEVYGDDSLEPFFEASYSATDNPTFPLLIPIPQARLDHMGDGVRMFHYVITSYNDNQASSEKLTLLFDRVAPYPNALPPKFAAIDDVTDANKNAVKLQLPAYADHQPGDKVYIWWLKTVPSDLPPPNITEPVDTVPKQLDVPLALIEDVGDGGVKAVYTLADKAGNFSSPSEPLDVGVALGLWPTAFGLPAVDLASDNGLIDQADVAQGVDVEVPYFDNAKETDEIRVHWGAKSTGWRQVAAGTFPVVFRIESLWIWEEYGADQATGEVEVDVTYEVRRGTVAMLEKDEKAITVTVNLERIGPVDPDPDPEWPGPINGKLAPAEVYGAVTNKKNTLDNSDAGQPVNVDVPVHAAFQEDDVVTLFWRGEQVPGVEHTITSDELDSTITLQIPWGVVGAVGNGTIPMYYAVRRPGNPNATQPAHTEVVVSGLVIQVPAPAFEGLSTNGFLNCNSIWSNPPNPADPAVRVAVPDLAAVGFKVGDNVQMIWRATVFGTDQPIPTVDFTQQIELDATNIGGFVWRIPYVAYVLPIYKYDGSRTDGNGYASYKSLGGSTPIESDEVTARVSIHSAGITCDISGP